jgi:hypothetical protein
MANLHNDEPTLVDELDRAALVRRVSNAVAYCSPPQVFGVHGDWGTGKTSFLHQLHWDLVGECPQQPDLDDGLKLPHLGKGGRHAAKVTVVWFEAWRYQHEKAPVVALLQEIRAQLPWYSKALTESRKLSEVAIRGALLSLEDLTKRIGIQASKVQEAGERWEEENLATRLPAHMIRQHLEDTLRKLLRPAKSRTARRLVVLVDDLDRCESETAYQLLEGIKIYLNLPSCVFVLGMNQDIIEGAVGRHLPEPTEDERRRRAREYLEKLCQNVWHIPLVREPGALLTAYVKGHPAPEAMAEIVSDFQCLPPVPRKIKGYANLLLRFEGHLEACKAKGKGDGVPPDHWAKVAVVFTYLYHFHHALYRLLWETPREFYDQLLAWCEGRPTSASSHFDGLERRLAPPARATREADAAEQSPTPKTPTLSRVFLDPAADNILHVEHLVRDLGATVTDDEVEANLLQ